MSLRCACCEVNPLMPTATRTHPDRLATATPAEKRAATEKFQVRSFTFNQPCACVKPPMAGSSGRVLRAVGHDPSQRV